jgi:glutaredoxin|tara:strand:- start:1328 stop:1558 length:231 start_codon:yes stop_codon:yes gene_type:complete
MKQAVIYSNKSQECERVESFLKSIDVSYQTYYLDKDFTDNQFYSEFGKAQYPQVAIGIKHIGGLKEVLNWNMVRVS